MRYACHFYLRKREPIMILSSFASVFSKDSATQSVDDWKKNLLICHFTFSLHLRVMTYELPPLPSRPRSFGWISFLMRHKTRWFICHSSSVMNELSNKSVWVLSFACEVNDSIRELHFRRITDWCWWWLEERRRSEGEKVTNKTI